MFWSFKQEFDNEKNFCRFIWINIGKKVRKEFSFLKRIL